MSLGFGYRTNEYARFVSTLRYAGYEGDIVLAAGPRFQRGVEEYLQSERVLARAARAGFFSGRRGRGRDVDITWGRIATPPRPRAGYSVGANRGTAAAASWIFRWGESRHRRGRRRG